MQPCWCPHEPVLCSQGGRSSCSLTMTPWLPTAGLMQRLQTLDTQLDCGSCNPIPAFSNREWGPYDCTLSSARLWLGLPCDAIQIQSSLQKPTWKQPLWNLHGGFSRCRSHTFWAKTCGEERTQLGSGTNLSRSQDSPNQTRVYNSLPKQFAICLQKTENNCMFLIIFNTGANLCLVNCYCVCTVVNNLTLMKSAPLQYSSKRCNFDHRGVSAFQLST